MATNLRAGVARVTITPPIGIPMIGFVPPVQAELAALRLGQAIGLVTAPGEIFTEIGQCIVSRSPFRHTLYAGYTDGTIGYVPTRAAYAEGGYEVTHACRVAPEAGEQIEDESVRLLRRVHGATCARAVELRSRFSLAQRRTCDAPCW